jgi:mannonate dehydratase
MKMTFRWYGESDPVPLGHIAQIPAVKGIVSALHDVPVGQVWPLEGMRRLKEIIGGCGLDFTVIESIPVHEDIKLGLHGRDRLIGNYCESVSHMGLCGIPVLCYNFMPVFDWTRSELAMELPDGSRTLAYDHERLKGIDLSRGAPDLPGWGAAYSGRELGALLEAYSGVSEERLWDNLAYFLERVVPVARESGVLMAIHPDDPPWPVFGLPRIIRDAGSLERLVSIVDSPANGITVCTGSLAPDADMDIPSVIRKFSAMGRVHFLHARNIRRTGGKSFYESGHMSEQGDVDMYEVMRALVETGFKGALRPDHGRMIWGETGRPGYGLHDRALGAMYLAGIIEALEKQRR